MGDTTLGDLVQLEIQLLPQEIQFVTNLIQAIRDFRDQKITAEQAKVSADAAVAAMLALGDPAADAAQTDAKVNGELDQQFPKP